MMSYDDFLCRGLEGRELFNTIKGRAVTHHDMLTEMRDRQIQLSKYAKCPLGEKSKDGTDAVQRALMGDIKFLETMAWRLYMFGNRSLFKKTPDSMGELEKRKRTDPGFWAKLSMCKAAYGPAGCNYPANERNPLKNPCSMPKCTHKGAKHAVKWLKNKMRNEWEKTLLRLYNY
jgi:hypothetical protein